MAEFKNLARAFVPGVAAAERKLKEVAVQTEDEDEDREHKLRVRKLERRTDEALAEGRALAAEFNLDQMKRAIAASHSGQILSGPAAARAIEGPARSVPMIEAPADASAYDEPTGMTVAGAVTDHDIEEMAARFARQAEAVRDAAERQRLYHNWSRDLRSAMPEFQAVEVERRARAIVNSYR